MYILLSDGVTKQYFFTTASNASYQKLILFYQVPPGVTPPDNATWSTPTVGTTPCMYFDWSASMGKLFGYTSLQIGNGVNASASAGALYTSDAVSELHNVSSIVFLCNLIKNTGASYPSSLLTSLSVGGTSFGGLMTKVSPKMEWNHIADGVYPTLEITIADQNMNILKIRDTNLLIVLSIQELYRLLIYQHE
jgi:hypothetical protein